MGTFKVILTLCENSPVEAEDTTGKLKLLKNSKTLSVDGIEAGDNTEALGKAIVSANDFLNEICWRDNVSLKVEPNQHRIEHSLSNGVHQTSISIGLDVILVTENVIVVKKDANGNIIEIIDSSVIGPIQVKPNESKAYYRQARISYDPFEQFRNYYLVCENIADKIRIKDGQGSLNEQPLLEYAIRRCFTSKLGQLEQTYKSLYGSLLSGDIVSTVSELLYKANRCQLNHAKSTADKKVPFNVEDEESVKKALPVVELLALSLLKYEDDSL